MIPRLILTMILSLALTEAVELCTAWVLQLRDRKGLGIVALVNLLTNPVVVLLSVLIPRYSSAEFSYGALVAVLELWAWLTEALIYRRCGIGKYWEDPEAIAVRFPVLTPFLLSSVLNLASFAAGKLV
ncbi:MAG: hypothetical protein IKI35_04750 [Stomatobaculum sp.]|nr:hypothetical protein [Stomatobaculum sp.]MBR7058016.1 hypothetical protein [Stomatobaculum sp.]